MKKNVNAYGYRKDCKFVTEDTIKVEGKFYKLEEIKELADLVEVKIKDMENELDVMAFRVELAEGIKGV